MISTTSAKLTTERALAVSTWRSVWISLKINVVVVSAS